MKQNDFGFENIKPTSYKTPHQSWIESTNMASAL